MTKNKLEHQRGEPPKVASANAGERVCLTFAEFGERVGLSAATIRRLCKTGDIEVRTFNKRLARIPVTELALFS